MLVLSRGITWQLACSMLGETAENAYNGSSSFLWGAYSSLKQLATGGYNPAGPDGEFSDEDDYQAYKWPESDASSPCSAGSQEVELGSTTAAVPLDPGQHLPRLSEQSDLLTPPDIMALTAAVPMRHKWHDWQLLYSTSRWERGLCCHSAAWPGDAAACSLLPPLLTTLM